MSALKTLLEHTEQELEEKAKANTTLTMEVSSRERELEAKIRDIKDRRERAQFRINALEELNGEAPKQRKDRLLRQYKKEIEALEQELRETNEQATTDIRALVDKVNEHRRGMRELMAKIEVYKELVTK